MSSYSASRVTRPLSRRGFLGLAAAAAGGAVAGGCSREGAGLTVMTHEGEFGETERGAAEKALGMPVRRIEPDLTRLTAMLAAGGAPDVVRAVGTLEAPFLAASGLALDLDPYFAGSRVLRPGDLDAVNDVWRFDGRTQGKGPRYGLAKDYSQDGMFWCDTAVFDRAGVDVPDPARPLGHEEWLDLARRLTVRRGGRTATYGLDVSGLGTFVHLMGMTAQAGGRVFDEGLGRVDFSAPEPLGVLEWYLAYVRARVGFSPADPDPDGWSWPAFQAGRMGMAMAGYWFGALIAEEDGPAARSVLMPAPLFGEHRVSPCYAAAGLWIPRSS